MQEEVEHVSQNKIAMIYVLQQHESIKIKKHTDC